MAEEFLLEAQKAFKEKLQQLEEEFKAKINEAKQESQFVFNAIDEKYHKDTQELKTKQEEAKEAFEKKVEREKVEFAKRQENERESLEAKQLKELGDLENSYKKDHAQATDQATHKMKTVQPNLSFDVKEEKPADDIGKELECLVCFNQMRPPIQIWQCGQGHAICENCKTNPKLNNTCPNCRKKIPNRNHGMEKIALAHFGPAPDSKFVTFISDGPADKVYHHIMGKYGKLNTTFSNFPVYQRVADEEPLFLFVNESGGWVVSDTLQSGSAWLHNQTTPTPKIPPTWNWMFYNVGKDEWNEDSTLRLVKGFQIVDNKRKRQVEDIQADFKPRIQADFKTHIQADVKPRIQADVKPKTQADFKPRNQADFKDDFKPRNSTDFSKLQIKPQSQQKNKRLESQDRNSSKAAAVARQPNKRNRMSV